MSWLPAFWNSSIEGLSSLDRYVYLYLIGRADALGMIDYHPSRFHFDMGCTEVEFERGLVALVKHGLVYKIEDYLLLTEYIWNRRNDPQVMEEAGRIYDELHVDLQTTIKLIPLPGLDYILHPERSFISAEERRLGFDPTQFHSPLPEPNPEWNEK